MSGPRPSTAGNDRDRFSAEELAVCLSHHDLGIVSSIQEFGRGSRRAPKVVIESERGKFLFKRRARGKDDLAKVAFTHQIQLHLASQNFPLPHLIGTRTDNNSMLVLGSSIYEMFEYIEAGGYDGSLDATFDAGRILGLYHKLLKSFQSDYTPPTGSYHNASAIHQAIDNTVVSLPMETRPPGEVIGQVVKTLHDAYGRCATEADKLGLAGWAMQIVHGDWHPGNMLFRDRHVVAVIDYDAARLQQRVIDLANGALQFSIIGGGDDPSKWPEYVDQTRFKRFVRGYDTVNVISKLELRAMPHLMCEAMIAEAVLPIAATGSFGRISGFPFLQMIQRKVGWILENIELLSTLLDE
ncbi:MAG TPA: phosphotransferase [Phycisphaerae bacterium]|nr:phosphotransferase [Phycisphaerae bacterium]